MDKKLKHSDYYTTMKDLNEEYYDDSELCNHSLEDFKRKNIGKSREEDVYVKAKVGTRQSMIASKRICRVLGKIDGSPLTEEKTESVTEEEILDRMPKKAVESYAVPSIKGEYLEILEFRDATQDDDGEYNLIKGSYETIPVEYVIDILDYNDAVLELDVYD